VKLDIVTVATQHIQAFARYTVALNGEYALRHDYGFHVFSTPSSQRHPAWGKVEIARELLPRCDWLFVIDADAIFLQLDKSLLPFTKLDGDLLICQNGPNGGRPLNTGAMLLRNTAAMQRLLQVWYDGGEKYARQPAWDQEALNDYFEQTPAESHVAKITALPFDAFNSHWYDYAHPTFYNRFVLHVMGNIGLPLKQQVFQQIHARRFGLTSGPVQPLKPPAPPTIGQSQIVIR
jgi:Nucleotide-diphospho-sugar transferase